MLHVFKKRFPKSEIHEQIKILKSRERERFHEFLITTEELPFCHDAGDMYKISKNINKKELKIKEFSSETAQKIKQEKLHEIIGELIDEYITY